jgi:nucleoside-diphosphate-sugar epimerase
VGANLVRALVDRGAEVHAVVRPGTDLWRIRDVESAIVLRRADLADRAALRDVVGQARPEIIFHLARGGPSPGGRDDIFQTNVLGALNLLDATLDLDYTRFVHAGSSMEYGINDEPMSETDLADPATFYGATKAAATLFCRQYARTHGKPIAVLRFFSVYGPWEASSRLIPTAIREALRGGELDLTEPGYRRDFVFVEDVVEALLAAAGTAGIDGEIINIGSGRQTSNEEVVETIQVLAGRRLRVRAGAYPARPTDTTHWVADIRKAERLLGWRPRHTLEDGISKTISWFREHGGLYPVTSRREAKAEETAAQSL